jgi:hypothetical protein
MGCHYILSYSMDYIAKFSIEFLLNPSQPHPSLGSKLHTRCMLDKNDMKNIALVVRGFFDTFQPIGQGNVSYYFVFVLLIAATLCK